MGEPGWLWEMRSAIVASVRDCNPMEVADDLGQHFLAITSVWPTIHELTGETDCN
jgi:hypothetical protein